ncbi:hypothetical protein FRB91_006548, partial [Serendipita sp. 411]
ATQTSYSVSFHTKVAVDRSQYEGAITLEYEWSYTPWFGRDTNVFGKINVTTSVGDNSYTNEIEVGDVTLLLCNYTGWNYTPFKHFGSIYFPVNDTRTIEYIPLAIDITFPREDNQSIDFYVKGAAFKIITQTTTTIGVEQGDSWCTRRRHSLHRGHSDFSHSRIPSLLGEENRKGHPQPGTCCEGPSDDPSTDL